jgi:hypothetical protein
MFNEDPDFLKPNTTGNPGIIGPNTLGEDERSKMQEMSKRMGDNRESTAE